MKTLMAQGGPLPAFGGDLDALLNGSPGELGAVILVVGLDAAGPAAWKCLDALHRFTAQAQVVVIEDSTSEVVRAELARRAERDEIDLTHPGEPAGAWRWLLDAVASRPRSDLVVVRADVEVGPGWLRGLRQVSRSLGGDRPVHALCTQVVPALAAEEPASWAEHLPWADVARAAAQSTLPFLLPHSGESTGCTLFPAAVLGPLLAELSGGDFGRLALAAFHRLVSQSPLGALAPRVLVRSLGLPPSPPPPETHKALRRVQSRLRSAADVQARRLYLTSGDGTEAPALGFGLRGLTAFQDAYVLEAVGGHRLVLSAIGERDDVPVAEWRVPAAAEPGDLRSSAYAEVTAHILLALGIELIHLERLDGHPADALGQVCRQLDVPLVVAPLDYADWISGLGPPAAASDDNRHAVTALVGAAQAMVVPSEHARTSIARQFERAVGLISVIEPGVEFQRFAPNRRAGRNPGPPRIVAMSRFAAFQNTEFARAVAKHLGLAVEWHALGPGSDQLSDFAVVHGDPRARDLSRVVVELDPDLSLVIPAAAEAYPDALWTSWALGVPVLVLDGGEGADRVVRHGGGLVLPGDDPKEAANLIAGKLADPQEVRSLRRGVPGQEVLRRRAAAAEAFLELYRALESRTSAPRRWGYVIDHELGRHTGCEHVRVLRRLANVPVGARISVRQMFVAELISGDALAGLDALLVQRTALHEHGDAVLERARAAGVPIVFEMDDDLRDPEAWHRMKVSKDMHAVIAGRQDLLVRSADRVIVSTETLRERVRAETRAEPIVVVNELDPRLWLREIEQHRAPKSRALRLLYMGTTSHLDDLMLLRPVMDKLSGRVGKQVILEVVGIADDFNDDEWIERRHIPRSAQNYPQFVKWLRERRLRWAAAVAPLVDNEFNAAKSDLKLLEYGLLGLPVVASDVGPYRGNEEFAVLTPNDTESWTRTLAEMLSDPAAAATRAAVARQRVTAERMITEAGVQRWLDTILGTPDRTV